MSSFSSLSTPCHSSSSSPNPSSLALVTSLRTMVSLRRRTFFKVDGRIRDLRQLTIAPAIENNRSTEPELVGIARYTCAIFLRAGNRLEISFQILRGLISFELDGLLELPLIEDKKSVARYLVNSEELGFVNFSRWVSAIL